MWIFEWWGCQGRFTCVRFHLVLPLSDASVFLDSFPPLSFGGSALEVVFCDLCLLGVGACFSGGFFCRTSLLQGGWVEAVLYLLHPVPFCGGFLVWGGGGLVGSLLGAEEQPDDLWRSRGLLSLHFVSSSLSEFLGFCVSCLVFRSLKFVGVFYCGHYYF